jgi:hypothetical protein
MRDFSSWLDDLPSGVSVISIMTQCYCGGFSDTIFRAGDPEQGFPDNLRTGFFAQRHDLPAAGCRPEIDNDEEYSSFFWGAFIGRSRTGKPVGNVDCNSDKRISFAEAHAYAVLASETIDIPLCASEALLRRYSRIGQGTEDNTKEIVKAEDSTEVQPRSTDLSYLRGTIYEIASRGRPDERRMIIGLAEKLKLSASVPVERVTEGYQEQRNLVRSSRGAAFRRGRGSSSRRRMQTAVIETWPELESPANWPNVALLSANNGETFLTQLREFTPSVQKLAKNRWLRK